MLLIISRWAGDRHYLNNCSSGDFVLPSLQLLYLLDEVGDCGLNLKGVGHQWYSSYEYSDFLNVEFDLYIVSSDDLSLGDFHLLEFDHHAVLPTEMDVRILITSGDIDIY